VTWIPAPVYFGILLALLAVLLAPIYYALVAGVAGALMRPARVEESDPEEGMTAVVCFTQEGERLPRVVRAFLEAEGEFPRQVVLVGDAPDDEAGQVARELAALHDEVELLLLEDGRGKAPAQALGVARARYPILLLLDAGTILDPSALRRLYGALAAPGICYAAGRILYEADDGAEGHYWHLEHWIKRYEDAVEGPLGGAGGLMALRRDDYVEVPAWSMLDLVLPCLLERLTGGRGRYVEGALGREAARASAAAWLRARLRIQSRCVASATLLRGWLSGVPWGRSFRFLVHKLLRWYAGVSLVLLALLLVTGNADLRALGHVLVGSLLLSCLVAAHRRNEPGVGLLATPGYVVSAQLIGWWRGIRGRAPSRW
jgi:hypothetical protein